MEPFFLRPKIKWIYRSQGHDSCHKVNTNEAASKILMNFTLRSNLESGYHFLYQFIFHVCITHRMMSELSSSHFGFRHEAYTWISSLHWCTLNGTNPWSLGTNGAECERLRYSIRGNGTTTWSFNPMWHYATSHIHKKTSEDTGTGL